MGSKLCSAKVDNAVSYAQEPRIGIEGVHGHPGPVFYNLKHLTGRSAGLGAARCPLLGIFIAAGFARESLHGQLGHLRYSPHRICLPAFAVPDQPASSLLTPENFFTENVHEAIGIAVKIKFELATRKRWRCFIIRTVGEVLHAGEDRAFSGIIRGCFQGRILYRCGLCRQFPSRPTLLQSLRSGVTLPPHCDPGNQMR